MLLQLATVSTGQYPYIKTVYSVYTNLIYANLPTNSIFLIFLSLLILSFCINRGGLCMLQLQNGTKNINWTSAHSVFCWGFTGKWQKICQKLCFIMKKLGTNPVGRYKLLRIVVHYNEDILYLTLVVRVHYLLFFLFVVILMNTCCYVFYYYLTFVASIQPTRLYDSIKNLWNYFPWHLFLARETVMARGKSIFSYFIIFYEKKIC